MCPKDDILQFVAMLSPNLSMSPIPLEIQLHKSNKSAHDDNSSLGEDSDRFGIF
jgi:hypothetical protein